MPESGGLFIADAEPSGGTGDFDSVTDAGGILSGITAAKNNGSYGYKIAYDGTNATGYGVMSGLSNLSEIFVRMYVYIPTGLNGTANYKQINFFRTFDGGTQTGRWGLQCNTTPWNFDRWYCQSFPSGGSTTTTDQFANDTWIRVEGRFYRHASAGGCVLRIDGTDEITLLSENSSALYVDEVWLGSIYSSSGEPPNGDYFYFDDCKASDSDWVGAYSAGETHGLAGVVAITSSLTDVVVAKKIIKGEI
jgi:hypothetical protein